MESTDFKEITQDDRQIPFLVTNNDIDSDVLKEIVGHQNDSDNDEDELKDRFSIHHVNEDKEVDAAELLRKFDKYKNVNINSRNKENVVEFASVGVRMLPFHSSKDALNNTSPHDMFNTHRNVDDIGFSSKFNPKDRSKSRKRWFD